jgi:hypothetical protein
LQKQGNNKLKIGLKAKNKILLREAVDFYTKGLELKCQDTGLNSVLLSNRAHVELLLGNWRKALQDSHDAREADPSNVKVHEFHQQLSKTSFHFQHATEGNLILGNF